MNFYIFANAALGKGLSGGDRIFIEFARRLSRDKHVVIQVWEEGYIMCKRQGLEEGKNLEFDLINVNPWCKLGFLICYLTRILSALYKALFIKLENNSSTVIYAASEFWMDSLPCFILKLRYPKIKWVAGWFQTAPNPLKGFSEGERERENVYRLSAFYHWFMQLPIKPLISNIADLILVNNDLERRQFGTTDKTLVILGAVDVERINEYREHHKKNTLIYDAVFQGRFHPQKGVVELINIWKKVSEKIPGAKLAMIGNGPLMNDVIDKIKEIGLEDNVKLFGYLFDGEEKYRIFSQSKLVVHPAFFDSGGMASAEAMAFGIPCVGFNLDSYKSYYPKGMVKVTAGDLNLFAKTIVELINSKRKREEIGKEAQKMIQENWSWDQRVEQLLKSIPLHTTS
ncbi:glycosyltransferase [Candidatus Daviesbacteria bacterium]|nr:glycosyltransferase [Candidatus Daviesbacteria bacterium]